MSNKFMGLFAIISLVFMIGMGAGLFMLWNKMSSSEAEGKESSKETAQEEEGKVGLGPMYSLDTFIVNLADDGGSRYLRVTMQLEMKDEKIKDALDKRLPQIRDSILMILPVKTFVEIQTISGKRVLREEILAKLNSILGEGSIVNLYFTEFVVQ